MIYPAQNEKLVQKLKEKNITCFAMESWDEKIRQPPRHEFCCGTHLKINKMHPF
jgi:hypothetical protein